MCGDALKYSDLFTKIIKNTPGTAGGPGGRDRKLAVKSRKIAQRSAFFHKKNDDSGRRICGV